WVLSTDFVDKCVDEPPPHGRIAQRRRMCVALMKICASGWGMGSVAGLRAGTGMIPFRAVTGRECPSLARPLLDTAQELNRFLSEVERRAFRIAQMALRSVED